MATPPTNATARARRGCRCARARHMIVVMAEHEAPAFRRPDDLETAERRVVPDAEPKLGMPPGTAGVPAQILALQRQAGNSAVSRMLAGASTGMLTEDEGGGLDQPYDAG